MSNSENILIVAEKHMRQKGYNAVSFRDIAAEVGIKSASLHYHFPKKEDLGVALVTRYSRNFHDSLIEQTEELETNEDCIRVFINLHRRALSSEKLICLCGVLGSESQGLPASINGAIKDFFTLNIAWLSAAYVNCGLKEVEADAKAKLGVAALEGALIIAIVNKDESVFEAVADSLL